MKKRLGSAAVFQSWKRACLLLAFGWCLSGLASEHRDKGYLYLSPQPGSEYCSRQTRFVLVRFANTAPQALTNLQTFIQVTGASSGNHTGPIKIASDNRTIIFSNSTDFAANELVTVQLNPRFLPGNGVVEPYQYQFRISKPFTNFVAAASAAPAIDHTLSFTHVPQPPDPPIRELTGAAPRARILPNGISVPRDFPLAEILTNNNPGLGHIFIDYDTSVDFAMIMGNDGLPVWYKRGLARDFKLQMNGLLTQVGSPGFLGYNQNFVQVSSYRAVNGYSTDDHELQVRPNGGYFLFGLRTETVDMRRFVAGGKTNASVSETVLQEFTPEGDLIFQYRAWDHYDIRLLQYWSYDDKPTSQSIRFTHMNAVDVDHDGNLLVSNKRVSEVTKINRDTGEVIWRLGGNHPDPAQDPYLGERLRILNDPLGQFNVQHDIRVVGTNRYSLFDNHWLHMTNAARAVDYMVDEINRTATLVWQYQEAPPIGSYHMGNAQRLPNGNTLINWVVEGAPKVTEVTPAGAKAFEMNWVAKNSKSYRVFRFPWQGPAAAPYLLGEINPDHICLLFNKFGDPGVSHYRIYAGTSANPTTLLTTSATTLKRLYDLPRGQRQYFRVTVVSTNGNESNFSNEINVLVNLFSPGENVISNGDFSAGTSSWVWQVAAGASATWNVSSGRAFIDVVTPGTVLTNINLRQAGINLVQGMEYVLEYDAWSSAPRTIEVRVRADGSSATSYYVTTPSLTPVLKHFTNTFTMTSASDSNARLMFNLGVSSPDVYLDNISLVMIAPGDFDRDRCLGYDDLKVMVGQWGGQGTSLTADLNGDGAVNFLDFTILGESWTGDPACP